MSRNGNQLSVGWAGNRPPPQGIERSVRLTRETGQLLVSAAEQLKARAPREDFELEGYVVALDNEDVRTQGGTITVAGAVDGGARRVRVSLGPEHYRIALDAHGRMARVGCSGRLEKTGRQYELRAAHGFAILGDE